jgi:Fe-S-cluster containining protein
MQKRSPWYADGLRFSCKPDCGRCCTRHDDYAYVYLADSDVAPLAEALGLDEAAFRERHTAYDDGDLVLAMGEERCPFLDGARCGVYAVRPVQCRTFPFWKENLKRRADWEALASFCPGIGVGEHHALLTIQSKIAEREG